MVSFSASVEVSHENTMDTLEIFVLSLGVRKSKADGGLLTVQLLNIDILGLVVLTLFTTSSV